MKDKLEIKSIDKVSIRDLRVLPCILKREAFQFLLEKYEANEKQRAISLYTILTFLSDNSGRIINQLDFISKLIGSDSKKIRKLIRDFVKFGMISAEATRNSNGIFSGYSICLLDFTIGANEPLGQMRDKYINILNTNKELKEKELVKEKQEVLVKWNSYNVVVHSSFNDLYSACLKKLIGIFGLNKVLHGIDVYCQAYKSDKCYFKHKWTLFEFLSRKNGCATFCEKEFEDYLTEKPKETKYFDAKTGVNRVYLGNKLIREEIIK